MFDFTEEEMGGPALAPTDPAPDYAPFDQDVWEAQGRELAKQDTATQWALADWLLSGVDNIPNVGKRGDDLGEKSSYAYDAAERITGLTRSHLYDLAPTAKRIPASVRTEKLICTHH